MLFSINWDKILCILTYFNEISLNAMLGLIMSVIHLAFNQINWFYGGGLN